MLCEVRLALVVLLLGCLGSCQRLPGSLEMLTPDLTRLELSRKFVFPQPRLAVVLHNNTVNATWECLNELASSSIVGPDWDERLIRAADITVANDTGPVPLRMDSTVGVSSVIYMPITALPSFEGFGSYRFTLPLNCSGTRLLPSPVNFTITDSRRSNVGRVSSFIVLLAGGCGFIAALLGSSTPLLLTQMLALLTSSTAGAIAVQEEYHVLRYVVAPTDLGLITLGSLEKEESLMILSGSLCLLVLLLEGTRYVVETMWCCSSSVHVVDEYGFPTQRPGEEDATLDQKSIAGLGTIHNYRGAPVPPYGALVALMALVLGIVHYGGATGLRGSSGGGGTGPLSAAALLVISVIGFGLVAGCMYLSRRRDIFWCPYPSQISGLPRLLLPEGVWGPNQTREAVIPVLGGYRKGRKGVLPFMILMLLVIALATSVAPQSLSRAQLQIGVITACVALMLLLSSPGIARNVVSSILIWSSVLLMLISSILASTLPTSTHSTSTSLTPAAAGQLACTGMTAVLLTMLGVLEILIRSWELRRGNERRAGQEGERNRIKKLTTAFVSPQQAARKEFEAVVSEMMQETIALHTRDASPDDEVLSNTSFTSNAAESRRRRQARFRTQSVWRQGQVTVIASDAHQPSLAEFLIQDFDALPLETREELLLHDEERQKSLMRGSRGIPELSHMSNVRSQPQEHFVHHHETPCLQTLSLTRHKVGWSSAGPGSLDGPIL